MRLNSLLLRQKNEVLKGSQAASFNADDEKMGPKEGSWLIVKKTELQVHFTC